MSNGIPAKYAPSAARHLTGGSFGANLRRKAAPSTQPPIEFSPQEIQEIQRRWLQVQRAYRRYAGVVPGLIKKMEAVVVQDGGVIQKRNAVQELALRYIGRLAPLWQCLSTSYFECNKLSANMKTAEPAEAMRLLSTMKDFLAGDEAIGCLNSKNLIGKLSKVLSGCARSVLLRRL